MSPVKSTDVAGWLQVVAALVSLGQVTVEGVGAAIKHLHGNETDTDTQAEDDLKLAELLVVVAAAKQEAQDIADGKG